MKNEQIFFTDKSEIGLTHEPINPEPKKFWSGDKVGELADITDIAKAVREYVKKKYPKCKFSVTTEKYSGGRGLGVILMSAPFNPIVNDKFWSVSTDNNKYYSVNQHHIEKSEALSNEAKNLFTDIRSFYNQFNYNDSDPDTDYFSVGFYDSLAIGRWDKGFEQIASKSKTPAPKKTPNPLPEKSGSEPKYNIGDKVNYKTSKGSEDGTVKRVKFVASKTAYLYTVENPRGGEYNIWESNILFKVFGGKPETPKALFKIGDIVTQKGRTVKYTITDIIEYEGEISYTLEQFGSKLSAYLPETALELAKTDMPETPEPETSSIIGLPSTDAKTWNETFKIGDKVRVRWNFSIDLGGGESNVKYLSNENNFTIKKIIKEKEIIRPENPSGFLYEISNGQAWEGKDLELIGLTEKTPQPTPKTPEPKEEDSSLSLAIDELKETNDLIWEMYIDSDDTDLKKELRLSANDNSFAITEFSEDLFFEPETFLNNYFEKITQKITYDDTPISKEDFTKITNSKPFKNWFGDFTDNDKLLNDKLVSKVLKMDLTPKLIEPLIVYHGTWGRVDFSRFKFNKFPIIYFATNKSYAQWFANLGTGIMYECFLDIKFLCDLRVLGLNQVTWKELSDFLKGHYGVILPQSNTNKKTYVWDWIRKDAPEFKLINTIKEFGFTGIAHIENNPQDLLPNGEDNTTTAYMIFRPEQAKLVRYVENSNAFTDILFMKKGGSLKSKMSLLDEIKNLKF